MAFQPANVSALLHTMNSPHHESWESNEEASRPDGIRVEALESGLSKESRFVACVDPDLNPPKLSNNKLFQSQLTLQRNS